MVIINIVFRLAFSPLIIIFYVLGSFAAYAYNYLLWGFESVDVNVAPKRRQWVANLIKSENDTNKTSRSRLAELKKEADE